MVGGREFCLRKMENRFLMENLYIPSIDQKSVLQLDQSVLNILYHSQDVANHSAFLIAVQNFLKDSSTFILCSSSQDMEEICSLLENSELKNSYLKLAANENLVSEIDDSTAKKIRQSIEQSSIQESLDVDFHRSKIWFSMLSHLCDELDANAVYEVIDTITAYDNSERLHLIQMELSDLKESNFDFTETQNYLNRLSKLFKQEYRFALQNYTKFTDSNAQAISKIKTSIDALMDKMSELNAEIIQHYVDFDKLTYNDILLDIELFKKLKYSDVKVNIPPPSKKVYSLFKNRKPSQTNEVENLFLEFKTKCINIKLPFGSESFETMDVEELNSLEDRLSTWYDNSRNRARETVLSINSLNFPFKKDQLQTLEKSIIDLVSDINQLNVFSDKIEVNSVNFLKQLDLLKSLEKKISKYNYEYDLFLKRKDWFDAKEIGSDAQQKLLNALMPIPTREWESTFASWYFLSKLKAYYSSLQILDDEQEIATMDMQSMAYKLKEKKNSKAVELKNVFTEKIKDKSGFIYDICAHQKQKTYPSWHQYFKSEQKTILAFFPVIVTTFNQCENLLSSGIDSLIYINPHTINIEILHYFSTIRTFYHNDHLPENAQADGIVLSSLLQMHDFSTWHYEKAFSVSKLLTYRTLPIIYQMKQGIIVSYLPEKIDSIIQTDLYTSGIKRLADENNIQSNLMTLLLQNGNPNILITLDNFIYADCYCDSRHTIQYCIRQGFRHINIPSKDIIEHKESRLIWFRETLSKSIL